MNERRVLLGMLGATVAVAVFLTLRFGSFSEVSDGALDPAAGHTTQHHSAGYAGTDTDAGQPVRARLARWRLSIPPT